MEPQFKDLQGKTLFTVVGAAKDSDRVELVTTDGEEYLMHHSQDCCETVSVAEVIGDLDDLIGQEIMVAEEVVNNDPPIDGYHESETWTFYKLRTRKGEVVIRWVGNSNGYYSEHVDFVKVSP